MPLTLPWLVAAVVSALAGGSTVWTPAPRWVERVVNRVVNETAKSLAARRGVRLTAPLTVQVLDRARLTEARALATEDDSEASRARSASPTAAALREAVLTHLGLAASADTARPGFARAGATTGGEITGLYDLDHERVLIANWADLATERFAWTRDVALALLDRHFSLARWLAVTPAGSAASTSTKSAVGAKASAATFTSAAIASRILGVDAANSDAALCRQAMAQGDATVLALESLDPAAGLPSRRGLAAIVAQVRDSLMADTVDDGGRSPWDQQARLFVELDGLTFMAQLRGRQPWRSIDEVWSRPPVSTEQILHPEKYQRDERPDDVGRRLPVPPKAGWRVSYSDTLGEWGMRQFLGRAGDPYRADRAAAGWGGDRVLLLEDARTDASPDGESSGDSFVAWVTTWDDETDASDFAAEAAQALAALAGVLLPGDDHPVSGRLRFTDGSGRVFALEHRRRAVGLLVAAPSGTGDLLARLTAAAAVPARGSRVLTRGQGRGGGARPR